MRQSQLFTKTTKNVPKDETSINAQLLIKAGFIDKLFAGAYSILPLGLRVIKKIENVIREEMNNIGGQEVYLPALHPLKNYITTKRDKLDILFHTEMNNGAKLVLGQSHEEVIVPLVQKFVSSYKDLPVKVYQFQTKFRNELRAKSGIMRGREFLMKDLYSFHENEADLDKFYEESKKAYKKIYERFGLGKLTYETYASGGTFSKYSHEYQTLTKAGEDVIYICDKCCVAINKEIIESQKNKCLVCGDSNLREEKSVEVANIFKLKSKYSNAFNFTYKDKSGQEKELVMGCYGIGLSRNMGAIVEVYHDKNGIVWPKEVSPFDVHLILLNSDEEDVSNISNKLYSTLQKNNIEVLYDDRQDKSPGEKLADSDLIGVSQRVVISKKTVEKNKFEHKFRNKEDFTLLDKKELINLIENNK